MAKKNKVKKTLVEQILTKAKIEHIGLQINALEGILPSGRFFGDGIQDSYDSGI